MQNANEAARICPPLVSAFTMEQLIFIEQALSPVEHLLSHSPEPLMNLEFAGEVMHGLKAKLARMIHSKDYDNLTGFDVNEVLVIDTSLAIFSYGLAGLPDTPQKQKMSAECEALKMFFAPLVVIANP
jgi:hypothetical protein